MKLQYSYEVNFPFERSEVEVAVPIVTAKVGGQVVFKRAPWSNPVTAAPAQVTGLQSDTSDVKIQVQAEKGLEKTFAVDLKKGTYLFIYLDVKAKTFYLKQQTEPPGYD